MLGRHPWVGERLRATYKYVIVDEFQARGMVYERDALHYGDLAVTAPLYTHTLTRGANKP